jgi:ribosomal protein S18 acetylase RimI-like enzyme
MPPSRPYQTETDKLLMASLARQYAADHLHVTDLPYRLSSWALDDPENTRLWFDASDNLRAWAVLQTPFWFIDYVCPPGESALHGEILAWADQRARATLDTAYGHSCWFINIFADQTERGKELEGAGFACQADVGEDSWSQVWMRRPAKLPVKEYHIPEGFAIRSLAGLSEVEAYVELHRAVFESKNMTVEWRTRTLQHPAYRPDLDVVITAPDGSLAAFCIGWMDGTRGQIEPLGCHADFRGQGLGRVALAETLRRLQAAGATEIYVETDNYRNTALALYEQMGFEIVRDVWVYRKDYA